MTMRKDFAIFICTHGRPNKQKTLNYLLRAGYTGDWYLVLDDMDDTIQDYLCKYDINHLIMFNKDYFIKHTDNGTSVPTLKCIVYAKNAVEHIAKKLGYSYWVVADDDLHTLYYRYMDKDTIRGIQVKNNIDELLSTIIDYLSVSNFAMLGLGNRMSYMSKKSVFTFDGIYKDCCPYNFVFRNGVRDIIWVSEMGEDSITPFLNNRMGNICSCIRHIQLEVDDFETNSAGMKDTYDSIPIFKRKFYHTVFTPFSYPQITINYKTNNFSTCKKTSNNRPHLISDKYRKEI